MNFKKNVIKVAKTKNHTATMAFTSIRSPAKQLGGSNTLHKANTQETVKADTQQLCPNTFSMEHRHSNMIKKKNTVKEGSIYFNGDL